MPGGNAEAWPHIKPIFQAIAARVNATEVACDWVGDEGAGHFVKMVHNGIEYGDIQIICEAYHLMRDVLGMTSAEIGETFKSWNAGDLESYLIEITGNIFSAIDPDTGKPLVEMIADIAGQKGTGRWTVIDGMELGQPVSLIAEAVFARNLSASRELREAGAAVYGAPTRLPAPNRAAFLLALRQALLASKIVSYAQGFDMIGAAGREHGWSLNKGAIALMWRAGCIIRSSFLGHIRDAFTRNAGLQSLLLDPFFAGIMRQSEQAWRHVVSTAVLNGIPVPAFASALSYFDGFRCNRLPANLLQAQRDYFGAHTYERIDRPRGEFFHFNWTGEGGNTTSSSYNA
jgi:6-phosphogluconate dehydrogenase